MTTNPKTVSETIILLQRARSEWDSQVNSLTDTQLIQPDVCGWWSVKDVIAHIDWYENQMVELIERHLMDTGTDLWDTTLDERNARIEQENKQKTLEQVLTHESLTYVRLVEMIHTLKDEELVNPAFFAGMPPDWTTIEILRQNTWQHYNDHLPDIINAFHR